MRGGGPRAGDGRRAGVPVARTDMDISADVANALRTDARVDASDVRVEVVDGVVHLHGCVPSFVEKRVATKIAHQVKGVIDIRNELKVVPLNRHTDAEIAEAVKAALDRDVWVVESKIRVQVVEGVVEISGTVDSYVEKSYAERDARSVRGVVDVVNLIVIDPTVVREDREIAEDVRTGLIRNIRIDPSQIAIDVNDGVVYLRGSVTTIGQRWLAEDVAWWTSGVRDLVNELKVSG